MKERLDELTAMLAEEEKVSKLNMVLGLLVALLSGVIIGLLICPKRQRTKYIGCNNGCHNGNRYTDDDDCCDCEGGKCCGECDEERCCGETEYCGNEKCCCEEEPDDQTETGEENGPDEEKEKEYVRIK